MLKEQLHVHVHREQANHQSALHMFLCFASPYEFGENMIDFVHFVLDMIK